MYQLIEENGNISLSVIPTKRSEQEIHALFCGRIDRLRKDHLG